MRGLKGERRAARRRKAHHAPRGGTAGAQVALLKTQRAYAGSAKRFIRKKSA